MEWYDDHESKPAPGRLRLIQALVNTLDRESHQDRLADPAHAAPWLTENGLLSPGEQLTEPDRRTVIEVREALRALIIHNTGGPPRTAHSPAWRVPAGPWPAWVPTAASPWRPTATR